jgi:hypothetical protein
LLLPRASSLLPRDSGGGVGVFADGGGLVSPRCHTAPQAPPPPPSRTRAPPPTRRVGEDLDAPLPAQSSLLPRASGGGVGVLADGGGLVSPRRYTAPTACPHRPRRLGHLPHALAWGRIWMRRATSELLASARSCLVRPHLPCALLPRALLAPPPRQRGRCRRPRRRRGPCITQVPHRATGPAPTALEDSGTSPTLSRGGGSGCAALRAILLRSAPYVCAPASRSLLTSRAHAPPPRQWGRWLHAQRADGGGSFSRFTLCTPLRNRTRSHGVAEHVVVPLHALETPAPAHCAAGPAPTVRGLRPRPPPPRSRVGEDLTIRAGSSALLPRASGGGGRTRSVRTEGARSRGLHGARRCAIARGRTPSCALRPRATSTRRANRAPGPAPTALADSGTSPTRRVGEVREITPRRCAPRPPRPPPRALPKPA